MRTPGRAMRITSAPWSASIMPANGPGPMPSISTILSPAKAPPERASALIGVGFRRCGPS
ncbi:hypothetical protein D3C77_217730 [compost metagenome]